ncbi:hypothetical protein NC652_029385 [Populus alba x Populus x berolinensis]|nr:hypothetical protein NC652_029385 [Populus alba x Populus x berolinensis]
MRLIAARFGLKCVVLVLCRDMKPNNLLIGSNGQLKLADFGLARIFGSPGRKFTHQVFARWYRAPELLFGAKQYGAGVDVWAAGCIFAELLNRRPFLQGDSDIDQLGKIFQKLGTPTPSQWPDLEWLPDFVEYSSQTAQPWRKLCPTASDDALDLLSKLFTYDPKTRITVQQALEHRFAKSFNLKNIHYHWFPDLIFVFLLGTLHLYLCPQIRLSFPDQPLRENLTTQGLQIYMRVLLSCHRKKKARRVMPDREVFDGNAYHVDKIDQHGGEIRWAAGDNTSRNEQVPMSVDFSIFGAKPMSRPTINR